MLCAIITMASFFLIFTENSKAESLPDFTVSNLSIKYKAGQNNGYYLYATIENKGEAVTSKNYLSVNITGLEPIGLKDGYTLFLINEKNDDNYTYPKGYKKEYIGPFVEQLKEGKMNIVATVDSSKYFSESNEENNIFSKTVTVDSKLKEARVIFESGKNLNIIITNAKSKKNVEAQKTSMKKNIEPLIKGIKLTDSQKFSINNFFVYGTASTKLLSQIKRVELVKKFKEKLKYVPLTVGDWQAVLSLK